MWIALPGIALLFAIVRWTLRPAYDGVRRQMKWNEVDRAIKSSRIGISDAEHLLALTRLASRLLGDRVRGVQIMAELPPADCAELVRLGGERPADGVVVVVTYQVGEVELVVAEMAPVGSPEFLAEELAYERHQASRALRLGPTGTPTCAVDLLNSARDTWAECRRESTAARKTGIPVDAFERLEEVLDARREGN